MFKFKKISFSFSDIAGITTWLVIFASSLLWPNKISHELEPSRYLISVFFIVYFICFILVTRKPPLINNLKIIYTLLIVQLCMAFTLLWQLPVPFLPILTVIWVSILPYLFSLLKSIIMALLVVICWFTLHHFLWQSQVIYSALLYASFHLFAILTMHNSKTAEDATSEVLLLNAELRSTRQLLTEANKQSERTRIARDLHDLLGHHLTALIINLQIAGHLTKGEAQDKVKQCHSLAKLLMSDVREAVSSIKENQMFDLPTMFDLLIKNIPILKISYSINAEINIENFEMAKTILSITQEAITNSLKHSHADKFYIDLTSDHNNIHLQLTDNGHGNKTINPGNGLNGISERVKALNGKMFINNNVDHFKISIQFPIFIKEKINIAPADLS